MVCVECKFNKKECITISAKASCRVSAVGKHKRWELVQLALKSRKEQFWLAMGKRNWRGQKGLDSVRNLIQKRRYAK